MGLVKYRTGDLHTYPVPAYPFRIIPVDYPPGLGTVFIDEPRLSASLQIFFTSPDSLNKILSGRQVPVIL